MTLSTVFIWLSIALGFFLALPALWMLIRALCPLRHRKQVVVAKKGLGRSFLLGLIPLALGVAVIAAGSKRLGPIMGLVVAGLMLLWGFIGVAGHATLIGRRLWRQAGPWRQTRNGGLVLTCCAALPVVGWAVLLPALAVLGMGVNMRCWLTKSPAPAARAEAVEAPPQG
jgi:hypothetical protein